MPTLTIANVSLPEPHEVAEEWFDLTKTNRTASGRLVADVIARKRRLRVTWTLIKDSDLQSILAVLDDFGPLVTLTFAPAGAVSQTFTAMLEESVKAELWFTAPDGTRFWQNVSLTFVEA